MTLGVEIVCGYFLEREDEARAIGHINVDDPHHQAGDCFNINWFDPRNKYTLTEESWGGDIFFAYHEKMKYIRHPCPANWRMI